MIVVSATVVTDDPSHAKRAADVMSRAAVGLALDGVNVNVHFGVADDDDDEDGDGDEPADGPRLWFEREREDCERMPTLTGLPILP